MNDAEKHWSTWQWPSRGYACLYVLPVFQADIFETQLKIDMPVQLVLVVGVHINEAESPGRT